MPKGSLFSAKFPFVRLCNTGVEPRFFQKLPFFSKIKILFWLPNGIINYSEPSVKLKLLELSHLGKTGPEVGSVRLQPGHSFISAINFDGNIFLVVFLTSALLRLRQMDDRWAWYQIWFLCPQIITRIHYHDINEKLITATNTLDDSVLEVNLTNNQEVGYRASEKF